CIKLLICIEDQKNTENNNYSVLNKIKQFFQPYLSGTHASLSQRIALMNECITSSMITRRSLGFEMLSTALDGPDWSGFGVGEFGARPRDYGYKPNYDELVEWRSAFIDVIIQLAASGDPELERPARSILADKFRGIWFQEAMRDKLVDAARTLNVLSPWIEGWKAVRTTIYFDYNKHGDGDNVEQLPDNLAILDKELEPIELISTIKIYVLSAIHEYWALDADFNYEDADKYTAAEKRLEVKALQLGQNFAISDHVLEELGSELFSVGEMPLRAFGRGLVRGSHDQRVYWQGLIDQIEKQPNVNKNYGVLAGFIEEVNSVDPSLAQKFLDQCAQHPELRQVLVGLHPRREFTETDLNRCMSVLDDPEISPHMYGPILWRDQYVNLSAGRVIKLAHRLLSKKNGDDVVLDALSMRLPRQEVAEDTLGTDLRQIGLRAAIIRVQRDHRDSGGSTDYRMERVVSAALRFGGYESEKQEWLNTIFSVVDRHYCCIQSFKNSIQTTAALMPEAFLNRIFEGAEEQKKRRLFFINRSSSRGLPLAKIDIDNLIEWCMAKNDPNVWPSIAAGINLWSKDALSYEAPKDPEQNELTLTEDAIKFLEASPDPGSILKIFAERVTPSSWSGSRASVMQPRVEALGQLITHQRSDISKPAKAAYQQLKTLVENEKQREQCEDSQREQRFE
ncbi:hypothetical protein AI29_10260, partial [bacteria symbiont BFo2 of Frankliniella occidentalis]